VGDSELFHFCGVPSLLEIEADISLSFYQREVQISRIQDRINVDASISSENRTLAKDILDYCAKPKTPHFLSLKLWAGIYILLVAFTMSSVRAPFPIPDILLFVGGWLLYRWVTSVCRDTTAKDRANLLTRERAALDNVKRQMPWTQLPAD
jgi:hypothetical protein